MMFNKPRYICGVFCCKMGILRTILAIAVVIYHSYTIFGLKMTGGQVAVQSFYMISGFYMALILNEKYIGKGSYKMFISNRLLRIYPAYWLILLAALLMSLIGYFSGHSAYYLSRYISNSDCLPWYTYFYFIMENVLILGQDVLLFLGIDPDCHLFFTKYPLSEKHFAFQYLLVPQAWSVSLELMFYFIAPFIVRRKMKWQVLLLIIFLAIRFYFSQVHYYSTDPWTYRFFPFELPFFIIGSLLYHWYLRIKEQNIPKYIPYGLLIGCLLFALFYNEWAKDSESKKWMFYGLIALSIPYLFKHFKDNKIDRWIGELSFSIYISHHLIVMFLHQFFFKNVKWMSYYGYTALILSFVLALMINKFVLAPIEKKRQKRII